MNRVRALTEQGQAVWLDFISRDLLESGELARLVEEDGVTGVTSNPAIFEQAIGGGTAYDEAVAQALGAEPELATKALYEQLAIEDIRRAAAVLRPVWERTEGRDGFVSLEVSPHLARDTRGTVEEARSLWSRVACPNLMIKVPATAEGIPAIETLLSENINVNVTLMFSLADYEAVAGAYLRGLERSNSPGEVASVASFFVSRVDGKVDAELDRVGTEAARALRGRIGIANCKLAYRRFREVFEGPAFADLATAGAAPQRVLWASTSTKDPSYRDVLYVEELIGPRTVNTVPPATLKAFRDHGRVEATLERDLDRADSDIAALAALGVDLDRITRELQDEGVAKFVQPFDKLLATLDRKRAATAAL